MFRMIGIRAASADKTGADTPPAMGKTLSCPRWAERRTLIVICMSAQQLQGMRQEIDDSFEGFYCAFRVSRNIQHHRFTPHPEYAAALHGERCVFCALKTHAFGDAFEKTLADGPRGFRGHVALGNASSTGSDDQTSLGAKTYDCLFDCRLVVGDNSSRNYSKVSLLERFHQGRAGKVVALTARAGIAHGENCRPPRVSCRGGHLLPPVRRRLVPTRREGAGPPSTSLGCSVCRIAPWSCLRSQPGSFRPSSARP